MEPLAILNDVQIEYETFEKLEAYLARWIDQGHHHNLKIISFSPLLGLTISDLRDMLSSSAQEAINSQQPEKLSTLLNCIQSLEEICTWQSVDPSDESTTLSDLLSTLSVRHSTHEDLPSTRSSIPPTPSSSSCSLIETCPICFDECSVSDMRSLMV